MQGLVDHLSEYLQDYMQVLKTETRDTNALAERSLQDAKSELGLSDYQVRKWNGWHHHMALVVLAMSFILRERLLLSQGVSPVELSRCQTPYHSPVNS